MSGRGANLLKALDDFTNVHCSAHMLHNIVSNMIGKLSASNGISTLLAACRLLVKYVKQSGLQSYLKTTLKADNVTRWDSTMAMLRSIQKAQDDNILREKLEEKKMSILLAKLDSNVLGNLIIFLERFEEISLELQKDKEVSNPKSKKFLFIACK